MSTVHPVRRILVGLDAAGYSDNALNVAIDLAERFDAVLDLVHGVRPPHPLWPDLTPHDVEGARKALVTRLEATVGGARLDLTTEPHRLVVESTQHPAELLVNRAREPGADLLVVGRHRRRGLFDFGSTLRAVCATAPCPVWVQAGPVRVVRRILVPVDLSEESLQALRLACAWARLFEARVHVVHCFQEPELAAGHGYPVAGPTYVVDQLAEDARKDFETQMAAFDWQGTPHDLEFVEDDPAHCVLDHQDRVDLVMMGSHGRTGLSAALMGNVALAVLRDGHVPVVVLRHPERQWLLGPGFGE